MAHEMDNVGNATLLAMTDLQKKIVKLRHSGMTIFKIAGELNMDYHRVMEMLIDLELEKPKEQRKLANKARCNIRHSVEDHQRLIRERLQESELWG